MIRIAFASDTPEGLEGRIAQHFGRCPYYTFVDVEDGKVKDWLVVPNPAAEEHSPGQIPQFVAEQGAQIIVAGGMGPRAQEWFLKLGVRPFIRVSGKIKEVLPLILKGEIEPITTPEEECGNKEKNCGERSS
jgi:predicted Fe-Mo cluster-binding NifX family protein